MRQEVGKKLSFLLTDGFLRFQKHVGLGALFCNPASGNEKANVENKVRYLRRNLLVAVPQFFSVAARPFRGFALAQNTGRDLLGVNSTIEFRVGLATAGIGYAAFAPQT